jgi:uncharacterized membrane protein
MKQEINWTQLALTAPAVTFTAFFATLATIGYVRDKIEDIKYEERLQPQEREYERK